MKRTFYICLIILCIAVLSLSITACNRTEPSELSDDLDSLMFSLNGVVHTLPVPFSELMDKGWGGFYGHVIAPYGRSANVGIRNGNQVLTVHFTNLTGNEMPLNESYIDGFFIPYGSEAQVTLPGDITRGTPYDEVIATHGEPNGRPEDNETVLLRYYRDYVRAFMRVNTETNLVISMNFSMTDVAVARAGR